MQKLKQRKGITLIVLVITIIVLLILAGITINLTIGQDGIITRAQEAGKNMKLAEEEEAIKVIVLGEVIGGLDKDKIQVELDKKFGAGKVQAVDSGNGTITIEIKDSVGRQYAVEKNGDVVRENKWDGKSVTEPTQKTENQIHINTAAEFKWLEQQVNGGNTFEGYTIYLENSLDFGARQQNGEWETEANETLEWTPIGKTSDNTLLATFEGNGNTIRGIYVNEDTNYNGIFGNSSTIQNLTIKDSYIKGASCSAGIVGALRNGQVENCHNINTTVILIEGQYRTVGGVVGVVADSLVIRNCYNTGEITGNGWCVGGIVAFTGTSVTISGCHDTGAITEDGRYVGGVAAYLGASGIISDCYNIGAVTGNEMCVGGVLGFSTISTTIRNCYNIGAVIGKAENTGGIVGLINPKDNVTDSTVEKCYNAGNINGASGTGGIVGYIGGSIGQGTVINCYSKGQVTGTTAVGAVIGAPSATGENTFNNLYYLNIVGTKAIGELQSTNSSDDETNKIMSTKDDLKSYDAFLKWIENR